MLKGVPVNGAPASFTDQFERIAVVVPQQSAQEPIARLSGMDIRGDGAFLIGDVSESQVKMFDRGGRTLLRIGRRGAGPGEFQSPRYPRFGPDGHIYVADAQQPRIQKFDDRGNYVSAIRLDVSRIQGFDILADGSFVVLADADKTENLLLHLDSAGKVRTATLPIANILPEGESHHPMWPSVRSFSLAMRGDTAFVSSTLSNRLWQIHVPSGVVRTSVLNFDGYAAPHIDHAKPPREPREMESWARSVYMPSTLSVGAGEVYLPFVKGVLNYGDPMVLLSQSKAGQWHALSGAPPVVAAFGDSLVAIEQPDADFVTLGIYKRRR
ncbi:MAG TPA: 6-bladed beta-propeller [Longimicrobium sp.]